MDHVKYLRPKEAANFLTNHFGHGSIKTLAKLRCVGGGPRFHKIGDRLVAYTEPELVDWARSKVSPALVSTSDRGAR
jgi:hypothetical protein